MDRCRSNSSRVLPGPTASPPTPTFRAEAPSQRTPVAAVICDISVSLNGYVTGPNDSRERPFGDGGESLHDWIFDAATDEDRALLKDMLERVGAVIMGRTSFDKNERDARTCRRDPRSRHADPARRRHAPVRQPGLRHHPRTDPSAGNAGRRASHLPRDLTSRQELCPADDLVADVSQALANGSRADEAQRLLLAGVAKEALAGAEHEREDREAHLVDEIVLHQRVHELTAGVDDDLPVHLLLQRRRLLHHVAAEDRRIAPLGVLERGGDDVLRQAVQPVGPLAAPAHPPRSEVRVAASAQQQGLGAERLLAFDLRPRCEVVLPDLAEPATVPETLLAGRVLDDSVQRDVLADHDLPHLGSLSPGCCTAVHAGSRSPAALSRYPGAVVAGSAHTRSTRADPAMSGVNGSPSRSRNACSVWPLRAA